jgi:hypothetical protein
MLAVVDFVRPMMCPSETKYLLSKVILSFKIVHELKMTLTSEMNYIYRTFRLKNIYSAIK